MRITEIGHKRYLGSPAGAALLSRCFAKQDKYGGNNVVRQQDSCGDVAPSPVSPGRMPGAPEHKTSLQKFDERIRDVRPVIVGDARGRALHVLHQAIKIIARVGDADHADGGAVPELAASSSATETLKLVRSRSFRLRTTWRLSLIDCAASMWSSRVRKAIMRSFSRWSLVVRQES